MEGQSAVVFRSEDRSIDTHSAYFHVDFSKKRGSVQATLCSFIAWRVMPVCRSMFPPYHMASFPVRIFLRNTAPVKMKDWRTAWSANSFPAIEGIPK